MHQKTFVHLNPSNGVLVVVTATTTTYANKKECIDYYIPNNLTKEVSMDDQTSHDRL